MKFNALVDFEDVGFLVRTYRPAFGQIAHQFLCAGLRWIHLNQQAVKGSGRMDGGIGGFLVPIQGGGALGGNHISQYSPAFLRIGIACGHQRDSKCHQAHQNRCEQLPN